MFNGRRTRKNLESRKNIISSKELHQEAFKVTITSVMGLPGDIRMNFASYKVGSETVKEGCMTEPSEVMS